MGRWGATRVRFAGFICAASAPHSDDAHGILMTSTAHLAGVTVENFEGDGIRIDASSDNATNPAAANQWRIDGGAALNNKGYGLFVRGADVNAGLAMRFDSIGNHKGNYRDSSFLGNTYIACHSDVGVDVPSYQSGYNDEARTQQNVLNRSLYLNCYEEDGQYADLGANSIWIGGQGQAVVRGMGSVLKRTKWDFGRTIFSLLLQSPFLRQHVRFDLTSNDGMRGIRTLWLELAMALRKTGMETQFWTHRLGSFGFQPNLELDRTKSPLSLYTLPQIVLGTLM
jgi:hypothetical protein